MSQTKFIGYVGTYTKGDSKGIYRFSLDTETKQLSEPVLAAEIGSPTYVNLSSDNKTLYSVAKADSQGGVAVYSVNTETGELETIATDITDAGSPCHVSVNSANTAVVTANYHTGVIAAYTVAEDGSLTLASSQKHEGTGPHERQDKAHAHYSGFTPDEKYVVAVDLGVDKVVSYKLNEQNELVEAASLSVKPGSGPRHIEFHPNGKTAYVMTELSNEVIVLSYNAETGEFKDLQYLKAIPEDFTENSQGSAIHVSKDGKFVYAGNRGHNSIAIFRVNEENDELTFVEHASTEGAWPRDFEFDPTGTFIVGSNEESGNLVLFERDETTGKLTVLQSDVKVPYPVCVKFMNV